MERELVIGRIIKEFLERREKILEREQVPINHELQKAITIVGPRRSGKTYLLLSHFQQIGNTPKIFFPLDDDRIYPPTLNDLDISLKVLKELYPDAGGQAIHVF